MQIANSDKPVVYYSLDMIIAVGYRVNSYKATQFRIWATRVLKEYLKVLHLMMIGLNTVTDCLVKTSSKNS